MGQTLSEPVREKHSDHGANDRLIFASSAMQGWRISMEDAHTTELTLKDKAGYSFFGVYDGHGGKYHYIVRIELLERIVFNFHQSLIITCN
jgi:protein phosphatase 2C family protein 2/3